MFYTTLGYPDTNRLGKYLLLAWNKARKKTVLILTSSDILKWIIKQKQKRWYLSCIFYYNPFEDQDTETEWERPEDGDNQTNRQLQHKWKHTGLQIGFAEELKFSYYPGNQRKWWY